MIRPLAPDALTALRHQETVAVRAIAEKRATKAQGDAMLAIWQAILDWAQRRDAGELAPVPVCGWAKAFMEARGAALRQWQAFYDRNCPADAQALTCALHNLACALEHATSVWAPAAEAKPYFDEMCAIVAAAIGERKAA